MKAKKLALLALVLLLALLTLSACGGSKQSNFPSGKFIKSGTTDYGLVFNADGTFSVFVNGDVAVVKGTYTVKGDTFTETGNDGGCKSPMEFKYTFDGEKLTFKYAGNAEADRDCDGRYADFNNVTYTLAK
jgi:hypothetical protein